MKGISSGVGPACPGSRSGGILMTYLGPAVADSMPSVTFVDSCALHVGRHVRRHVWRRGVVLAMVRISGYPPS